jgi:pyrroline-5-carboxylate reductase
MSSLAFLGAGAMGEALMRGLLDAQIYSPSQIAAYDAATTRLNEVAQSFGIRAATSAQDAISGAEVLLVAVKPQVLNAALEPLRDVVKPEQTVISIAAGVTTKQIEGCFANAVPVVRVMPNTPALINRAATAICLGTHADEAHRAIAHRIFDAVGVAVDVDEKLLDAVTGLSGSGPAYVYMFIEALSDAGVRMGLPRDVATRLAAQTVQGSAQMVLETGQHPGALKDMVTSPGGTTIAGLHALERNAFRGAVIDAVEAATQRSRELSG